MAIPDGVPSSIPVIADYESPYDRPKGPLEDFEAGGIALNDGSQGLDLQIWYLWYNDQEDSPNYGDFTVEAEVTGDVSVVLNVPDVVRIGLAFNQNMDIFIAYETRSCQAKFYWFDPVPLSYQTVTLPAGSMYVACCLDDHRFTQTGSSDIIISYIRSGVLYARQQRDRFLIEYDMGPVGAAILHRVGMTKNLRLKWDVREGPGVRLSEIEGDIARWCGLRADELAFESLYPVIVRGFIVGGVYSGADTIRALMSVYFHDMVEVDGVILAVPRGGPTLGTIERADCVVDEDIKVEVAREQGLEFPYKLHLALNNAESDYTPTKATAERISINVKSVSELAFETAVNFTPEEAYQRAHAMQKIAWNEYEGTVEFGMPENFARFIPTDPINFEIRPGVFKRVRISKALFSEGYFKSKAVVDRRSSYTSGAVGLSPLPPETPGPTLPGDTTWEFMDAPTLLTSLDAGGAHYYVAGHGDPGTAWHGAQLQRLVGPNFLREADILNAEIMGEVESTLPYASSLLPDTTNTILVTLTASPTSITDDDIYAGRGAWMIGTEILQVRDWAAEGDAWRGSYLLRGRLDTVIPASHAIGERAVFLGNPVVVPTDVSLVGTTLTLRAPSFGQMGSAAPDAPYVFTGESQREWAPIDLVATQNGSDWNLSWTPRYRLGSTAHPVASVHFYGWSIRFTVGATTVQKTTTVITPVYLYTAAAQAIDFGSAQSSFDEVEVRALNHITGEGRALTEAVP